MEPEGSLSHSQVPATCPYPESARSSPCPHIQLPEDPSEYYPPIYAWVFQVLQDIYYTENVTLIVSHVASKLRQLLQCFVSFLNLL